MDESVLPRERPKISVCVVTYNQAEYIGQCLQSLLDQETSHRFEILVADDCSTDGTAEIVQGFAERYPALVRATLHKQNIGAIENYKFVHRLARGEYVAHMDGDDYALPGKIQAQADILDARLDVALSAHAVVVIGDRNAIGADPELPALADLNDLLRLGTYFVHSSVMYRRATPIAWPSSGTLVDYYLYVEHAKHGYIHLNPALLGAYRKHASGISTNPEYRDRLEAAYETAFDRAREFGVPLAVVTRGRLRRRKSFALARLAAGDVVGFRRLIALEAFERDFASATHRILARLRFFPFGHISVALVRRYWER